MKDHNTPVEVVKKCISLLNINKNDIVIDAGSGEFKEWFKNINVDTKYECELNDGNDFLKFNTPVDWVIGNPPYHIGWDFTEHASLIAKKGIAYLGSHTFLNSNLTPRRLTYMNSKGFNVSGIHVMNISKWYGRYFFIIYEKNKPSILTYDVKTYKEVI